MADAAAPQDRLQSARLIRGQQMIWAGHQIDPTSPVFSTAWRFGFEQEIDAARFNAAFEALVDVCDALRLIVTTDAEGNPQMIDTGSAAGQHETLAFETEDEAANWVRAAISKPFDIAASTFHSALICVGGTKWSWYINQHHSIVDAGAGRIYLDALSVMYGASKSVTLPSFVNQAEAVSAQVNAANRSYWENEYRRDAPLPRLYGALPSSISAEGVTHTISLGPERTERLNALLEGDFKSLSRDLSLYQVFLTALAAWTMRVSGEDAVPLGIVTHGRMTPTAQATAGCFIELFPIELEGHADITFRELFNHVMATSFDLFRKATPGTSSSRSVGSFNTVLNVINTRYGLFDDHRVTVDWLDNGCIDHHHAFRLNVMEFDETSGVQCAMAMNREVFDDALGASAIDHFLRIFDALLADPDALVHAVPLAAKTDQSTALTQIDLSQADPTQDVVDAWQASVSEDENASVVFDRQTTLTRRQLDRRSDAIANAMLSAGVAGGDRVGLHLTRSADLIAAMLAVLKVGATYVPLDPSQTPDRLSAIAGAADLRLSFCEPDLAAIWTPPGHVIDLASVPQETSASIAPADHSHPAYVIFTSGSTGVPKGVVVGRASLARYAKWANETFADDTPSCWALHSAIGFDLTVTSIFSPIVSGGMIRIYRETPGTPAVSVLDVFADDSVDVVKLTPAHLRLVLAAPKPVKQIKSLVLGGEDLLSALCQKTLDHLGHHITIYNEYGPTEATVGCMVHAFDPDADTDASVPVGRPASDTGIYVLDKALNPVPDAVRGELYVAGKDRLAVGYLNRPEDTAAAFVKNPFAEGLMYRTGDVASVRRDGLVCYHGRADDQLKISGVRIEPGEIRAAAQSIKGVGDTAVTMFDPKTAMPTLCRACGIPKAHPNISFTEPDLCRTCAEFDDYRDIVDDYFGDLDDLRQIIESHASRRKGDYDCVMLLSGGKDSTYALSRLSEITDRVLVATLDNGYISDSAIENIRIITERLGVEHRFLKTPAMNDIFVDSLKRHANVCQGCFKTIYTLGLQLARDVGAPMIITGLSRGQLFETRLAPELFRGGHMTPEAIDKMVLEARRSYHQVADVAAQRLNGALFEDGDVLEEVAFVDFYRYCDVPVSEVYRHLEKAVGWSRPMDTGRSTNCLINDVGIHVHKTRRGHHNYALPYSWDVRLGHKTRSESVEELNDDINIERVTAILDEIGFDEPVETDAIEPQPVLYYTSDTGLTPEGLRAHLLRRLPREVVPGYIIPVSSIPTTPNGKVDTKALPTPDLWKTGEDTARGHSDDSLLSALELQLLRIWRRILDKPELGADDNFYDAGGDSLIAIRICAEAKRDGLTLLPQDIFRHQTVREIANQANSDLPASQPKPPAPPVREPNLSARDTARLQALFGNKQNG